jgi:hypothetical protein
MLTIAFIAIIIAFSGAGKHGYLDGVMTPLYAPENMTFHYERIGNGPKKMVLRHSLSVSGRPGEGLALPGPLFSNEKKLKLVK